MRAVLHISPQNHEGRFEVRWHAQFSESRIDRCKLLKELQAESDGNSFCAPLPFCEQAFARWYAFIHRDEVDAEVLCDILKVASFMQDDRTVADMRTELCSVVRQHLILAGAVMTHDSDPWSKIHHVISPLETIPDPELQLIASRFHAQEIVGAPLFLLQAWLSSHAASEVLDLSSCNYTSSNGAKLSTVIREASAMPFRTIRMPGGWPGDRTSAVEQLPTFAQVSEIVIPSASQTQDIQPLLHRFPNLTALFGGHMATIPSVPSLQVLDIDYSIQDMSTASLNSGLSACTALTRLRISSNVLEPLVLNTLGTLTTLRHLSIPLLPRNNSSFAIQLISQFEALTNLTNLTDLTLQPRMMDQVHKFPEGAAEDVINAIIFGIRRLPDLLSLKCQLQLSIHSYLRLPESCQLNLENSLRRLDTAVLIPPSQSISLAEMVHIPTLLASMIHSYTAMPSEAEIDGLSALTPLLSLTKLHINTRNLQLLPEEGQYALKTALCLQRDIPCLNITLNDNTLYLLPILIEVARGLPLRELVFCNEDDAEFRTLLHGFGYKAAYDSDPGAPMLATSLTKLELCGMMDLDGELNQLLCHLTGLRSLNLGDVCFSNLSCFRFLGHMHQLEELSVCMVPAKTAWRCANDAKEEYEPQVDEISKFGRLLGQLMELRKLKIRSLRLPETSSRILGSHLSHLTHLELVQTMLEEPARSVLKPGSEPDAPHNGFRPLLERVMGCRVPLHMLDKP